MIATFIQLIGRAFGVLMVACLGLMVLMVFGNVVLRYGFNASITMSEELSRWLFVWMTFLGAVVGLIQHAHLGTDALVARLPLLGKRVCFVVAHLLMLAMCGFMFSGALAQTRINLQSTSAVMEVSMAWLYAAGLVFAVLAALVIAHELWRFLSGQLGESELIGITGSEDGVPHAGVDAGAAKERT